MGIYSSGLMLIHIRLGLLMRVRNDDGLNICLFRDVYLLECDVVMSANAEPLVVKKTVIFGRKHGAKSAWHLSMSASRLPLMLSLKVLFSARLVPAVWLANSQVNHRHAHSRPVSQ